MTELGTRLKEARLAKGYSLEDLQEMTKIQKRYLSGIEEGNYSMMPGSFYIRAFIKQYADAVGLNSDELLESYKQELPSTSSEEMQQTMTSAPTRRRSITKSSNRMGEVLPMVTVAVIIIIGIVIFWLLYQNLMMKDNNPTETQTDQPVSIEEPETKDETSAVDSETEEEPIEEEPVEVVEPTQTIEMGKIDGETTNYTLSETDTFSLKIVARGRAWVGVKNQSGAEMLGRELAEGETVTLDLSDAQTARIRVGASPQIDVFINDEKVEYGIPTTDRFTQNMMIQFSNQQ
ncbi:helix-turn-helix domain-containing protein [Paenisporosarcina antarctica]|uniref:Helix-turn-helix domain-containing protein n=1 Tax=Paenisporosarcina antarctica TaxID=417367 RepID=A0A4P6ZZ92_9BACL|nr:RodZ domain-containing protein [Paenisporosarcina antarctica]QBP41429.1 helix-turn-helix domain-containing protein [Paenisporosarcina antarctica]